MSGSSETPLFAWSAAARVDKRRKLRVRIAAWASAAIVILVTPELCQPVPRLMWNATASAPVGLYRVVLGAPLARDDMVAAWPPSDVRRLAAQRHYLPLNVPLIKRVAALPGDLICAQGVSLSINGVLVARREAADLKGRNLPQWNGCRRLSTDQFLLLNDHSRSFDGRYFGPTAGNDILGKAVPLWVR
jgi:conjugative transfer signal peptidase TraF